MKDKISFENSVREKSKSLIEKRKKQRKRAFYTASSLCVCFLVVFGIFLTMPGMGMKSAFDFAPEASDDADLNYSQSGAMGDYDYASDVKGSSATKGESASDSAPSTTTRKLPAYVEIPAATDAAATTVAAPYEPSAPVTTARDVVTEAPVSSTSSPAQTETPTGIEETLREHTASASVYTSLLATNTRSADDITALIDAVFAEEPKTEPSGEYTVKVVFSTSQGKLTYYLTEADVKDIVP